MQITRQLISATAQDNFFALQTNACTIRVYFMTDSIVRVRASFDGKFTECSFSLVKTAWPDAADNLMAGQREQITCAPAQITCDDDKQVVIAGTRLKLVFDKDPYRMCIYDADGSLLHADIPDLALLLDSNHRCIHTSSIEEDDGFFGFGEKSGVFNKKEKILNMAPGDAMGYNPKETDSLYKHIPFYIRLNKKTHQAVGYFYHNTAECDFDLGREKRNYWHRHSRYRADGGDIDLFFIAGPKVTDVVKGYTFLTGTSAMLPRQAFGYLGSSMYYAELPHNCDEEIVNFIDTVKEEGCPIDGFQLSSGYCTAQTENGLKRCVFTWNGERFSDPKHYFAEMDARDIIVSPNVKPGILTVHPRYQEMVDAGIFIQDSVEDKPAIGTWWGGPGAFADFTKEQTRQWWKGQLKEHLFAYGVRSVWNDNCEYDSLVDKDARCCNEGLGGTVGQLKAAMVNIFCHITKDALEEYYPNERAFIVSRSGHSGIQRYAQTWAGDNLTCWESVKYNIPTILGMGLSGVANQGCDIGGFYGPAPTEEMFVRWVQNGIFQPRFSIHSVNTDNTVTEPWMYSKSKDLILDAIKLRYRLIPYFYALERRAHETGLPILEPLFMEFQDDAACHDEGFNFMFGPNVLVANVVDKGQKVKPIYFPKGARFYDLNDNYTVYEGGQSVDYAVDMHSIPMFLKEGGVLVMTDEQLMNLAREHEKSLHLITAPDAAGEFTFYEDDGHSLDYQQGKFLKTILTMTPGTITSLKFTQEGDYVSAIEKMYVEAIHKDKCPFYVLLDGKEVPHILNRRKFEGSDFAWYYSQSKRAVEIKYPHPGKSHEIKISYEVFDMIGM